MYTRAEITWFYSWSKDRICQPSLQTFVIYNSVDQSFRVWCLEEEDKEHSSAEKLGLGSLRNVPAYTVRELEPARAESCRAPTGRLGYLTVITTRQMSIYIDRAQTVGNLLLLCLWHYQLKYPLNQVLLKLGM